MGRKSVLQEIMGGRPFPLDEERKTRCTGTLKALGLSQVELAFAIGVDRSLISNVISGRQPSPSLEKRIAMFLGVPETRLFPVRTAGDIARMREAEEAAKARKSSLRQARLAARANAGGVA